MSVTSPTPLLVLHGLRLAGFKGADQVAELIGLAPAAVEAELAGFADVGWAQYREGRLSGWSLTAEGRAEGERQLDAELTTAGCRDQVSDCYRRFLALNQQMLEVCTDWQMITPETLNDHGDPAYDAKVIGRLAELDVAVQPICTELGSYLVRLAGYGNRLASALAKVQAGEVDWFTKPMIPSYHTVWFELHEDLLATLNIDRGNEAGR